MDPDECSVQVALRVRPMMGAEKESSCKSVLRANGDQVFIGADSPRPFTFDYVFDQSSDQKHVYSGCVSSLVKNYLEGYNATILAYGQTGSGKTHTMGTACNEDVQKENYGILPRVIEDIFDLVDNDTTRQFKVSVQFLEIHNQDINDLLIVSPLTKKGKKSEIAIREQPNGEIIVTGVTEHQVQTREEMMACLDRGSLARTTGSTKMNAVSSRSHAIFTVFLTQKTVHARDESSDEPIVEQEENILTSKFHFVDLAGSERLKRTGATGERREEGISINSGLLALGNVISALADSKRRREHVPFRDSKITRLLQDSLGGNSRTLMIACVSPADVNEEETVSTLKYANRARNIKNKVVINRDPNLIKLDKMRARIAELEQAMTEAGVPIPDGGSTATTTSTTLATAPTSLASSVARPALIDRSAEILNLKKQSDSQFQEICRLSAKCKELRIANEEITRRVISTENKLVLYKQGIHELEGGAALATQLEGTEAPLSEADDFKLIYVQQRKITKLKDRLRKLQNPDDPSSPKLNTSITSETSELMSDISDLSDDSFDEEQLETESQQRQYDIQQLQNQDAHLTSQLADKEDAFRILSEAKQKELELTNKIAEMEAEVERIQNEKERALRELDKNVNEPKYKEQVAKQSKQLADLRAQIQQLRDKLKESENIKRSYERKGLQLKQLQVEIDDVKRQRVKLAKEITEKSEAHREAMKAQENQMKRMTKETRAAKLDMLKYKEMLLKKESILKRETEKNLFLQKQILGNETKRQNARMQKQNLQQALRAQGAETSARKRRAERSPPKKVKPFVVPAVSESSKPEFSGLVTPRRGGIPQPTKKASFEPLDFDDKAEVRRLSKAVEERDKKLAELKAEIATSRKQNELLLQKQKECDGPSEVFEIDELPEDPKYRVWFAKLSKRHKELEQREKAKQLELDKVRNELVVAEAEIRDRDKRIGQMEGSAEYLREVHTKGSCKREHLASLHPNLMSPIEMPANKENHTPW